MTPKEKAKELIKKYEKIFDGNYIKTNENIKQCALICVDEILKANPSKYNERDVWNTKANPQFYKATNNDYWQEVRNEINDK